MAQRYYIRRSWPWLRPIEWPRTGGVDPAGLVKAAGEEFETDDGVDDDDEYDEQSDVEQRHHGFEN